MKSFRKTLTVLLSLMLLTALTVPALAGADYSVQGEETSFNKYLVVDKSANVPNMSFSFTIEAGEEAEADEENGTLAVMAGVDPDKITIGTAVFTPEDETTDGEESDGIANSAEKKYATAVVTVDLSGVSFTEPGVYRYVITEQATENDAITPDATPRTLDVYVNNNEGELEIAAYVFYSGEYEPEEGTGEAEEPDGKNDGFADFYESSELTIKKTVKGNQGSHNKYFAITVKTEGLNEDDLFSVSGEFDRETKSSSATTYTKAVMDKANGVEFLTGEQLNAGYTFFLHHTQSVVIQGVPKGTDYTVTEAAEDYKCTAPENASGTVGEEDITVEFVNTRNGMVPTGLDLSLVSGVLPAVIGLAGAAALLRKKDRAD